MSFGSKSTKVAAAMLVLLIPAVFNSVAAGESGETYKPDWQSFRQYPVPEWFKDAKFGIYAHWGVYSVPAWKTEWYPHGMYMKEGFRNKDFLGYHTEHYGPPSEFGYKDFIPMFKGEKFDAEEWAELFRRTGARFAGPTAEHHDGFALWDSDLTRWDSMDMGPRVDVVGKLEKAIKARGMKFVTTFHHARNWQYYLHEDDYDTNDPEYAYLGSIYGPIHEKGEPPTEAYLEDWKNRVVEVIDKYQPDLLWFDGAWGKSRYDPYKQQLLSYYYNRAESLGRAVGVTYKGQDLPAGVGIRDFERGRPPKIERPAWLTDTCIFKNSWGYIEGARYYSAGWIIDDLVDVVSKNGCMLLNVGPKPNGEIPGPARRRFLEIGRWLKTNGDAIYGTRPWKLFGEGPTEIATGHHTRRKKAFVARDIRFTVKDDVLYAIALDWPDADKLTIETLSAGCRISTGGIDSVTLLGSEGELDWSRHEDGLTVKLPRRRPCDHAYVLKIIPNGRLVRD